MQEQGAAARNGALRRAQWLRAAILGANDGLLSTTSLILGIGAAKEDRRSMVLSGMAGAIAGSLGMAVGEFVSVSTQRDIEMSMRREKVEPEGHECHAEGKKEKGGGDGQCLAGDKRQRSKPRARVFPEGEKGEVTKAEDEKGGEDKEEDGVLCNPYSAASASALAFLCGAIVPIVSALVVKEDEMRGVVVAVVASFALALFGGVGAYIGGSSVRASATRVLVGGWVGMGITYGLLKIFDRDDD